MPARKTSKRSTTKKTTTKKRTSTPKSTTPKSTTSSKSTTSKSTTSKPPEKAVNKTKRFNGLVKDMRTNVEDLAKLTIRQYRRQAVRDGKKMITSMKKDLRRWTDLLDEGLLTTEDFEWLVHAQVSSTKMSALERSALAALRVDHFKKSMFNMVVDSVFEAVLPTEGPSLTK